MSTRPSNRLQRSVRVTVRGVDRNGNPFIQKVQTVNLSPRGACLEGLTCVHGPGQIVELSRWWKKARFRVVWVGENGTATAEKIGLCRVDQGENIWGIQFPPLQSSGQAVSAVEPPQAQETNQEHQRSAAPVFPQAPNGGKNFAVRLRCPCGDEDGWVLLQGRSESLEQVLNTAWDFECPTHGVQHEVPLEAREAQTHREVPS